MKAVTPTFLLLAGLSTPAVAHEASRVLVYGDSNTWGLIPLNETFSQSRLPDDERYAGVMADILGDDITVIVDGVSSRTTDLDQTALHFTGLAPSDFNGASRLVGAIAREMSVDIVVMMLGTNDRAAGFNRSAEDIANAAVQLAEMASQSHGVSTIYKAPQVLLVAPPPLGEISLPGMADLFAGGREKSTQFGAVFEAAAAEKGIAFYDDAEAVGGTDGADGVHLTAAEHSALGSALADEVRALLTARSIGSGHVLR